MGKSFEEINYTVRPGKQTERKLIVELLQHMHKLDVHINDYMYTGFGSVFFTDFILFHQFLHINKMICVERANVPNRMEFNCPYDFIDIEMHDFSGYLSKIDYSEDNFFWLDLDGILKKEFLDDFGILFSKIKQKTIVFLTIKADPESYFDSSRFKKKNKEYFQAFSSKIDNSFGKYSGKIKNKDLSYTNFPKVLVKIITNKIEESLLTRSTLKFYQLTNFKYSDSSLMLTLGGIVDKKERENEYKASNLYDLDFISTDTSPIEISVPPLTVKEKHWLDKRIMSLKNGDITSEDLAFELKEDLLKNYIKYYKHYPSFHEIVL